MFNDLRLEVIVRFVDIGGIVDHQCLYFPLLIQNAHAGTTGMYFK